MRARNRLTAATVRSLVRQAVTTGRPVKRCDGAGLWLLARPDGGATWVLRLTVYGRRREMGLGGAGVTLAQAREAAERWRAVAEAGRDPIAAREAEARAARREDISLAVLTADAFEARKAELKRDGDAGRWLSPLAVHVLPKLGRVPVPEIDQRMIRDVLAPIWHTKADVARKALGRLGIVLRHAAALGIDVDLQAPDKARALLGKSRHEVQHIPALHWRDAPGFYASLEEPSITHLALRLLILTGVRSGPLRAMRIDQIDGDIWTVPAEAVKGRKGATSDFRVPLSREALRCIGLALPHARDGFLFPGVRPGAVISDMTLSRLMQRRGMEARPHGFRSSLRTWIAECTEAPHEIAETVLGHVAGSAAVRAYRRTDFLAERRELLQRWADHVTGPTTHDGGAQ